jgi:glutamate N-acetyltransferase/amino-acid N-acetyltransferase
MEQINGSICAPLGFSVAGTYSGVCNRRVKLDLAMIMSRSDCSIVTFGKDLGKTQCSARVLLYHNGLSLTANKRADEITSEICQAAADHAAVAPEKVTLLTTGLGGQYFRPSLVINSINALVGSLSGHHDDLVENVMDNGSDVLSGAVSFHAAAGKGSLGGILAEGTADAAGLCLLTTDVAVTAEQVQQALEKNRKLQVEIEHT